jgi:hypothetical protein
VLSPLALPRRAGSRRRAAGRLPCPSRWP